MEKSFGRELKRGTLEMLLLNLLSEQPMYGYELISTLEKSGGKQFQIKEGTLYPVLYRLEDAGYIEPRWETQERGVPRKYYHITTAGSEQLERLLQEWQEFITAVNRLLSKEDTK
jgi:PadR family transcriptional regulator, regulatory protein PadR